MQKLEGKWLIGVSGGPDSMALLHMCIANGTDVSAAHVNYHHRDQAEEEEAYLRSYCAQHAIPLYVRNEPFRNENNFEADARSWRYDFFVNIVREQGFKGVLIAHNEDDLLETYLMQEEKNIVPEYYGLKEENMYHGMLVKRTLMDHTKKELQDYCDANGVRYYIDETNADTSITRNRMRNDIVSGLNRFERDMVLREIKERNAVRQERKCRVATMITNERVNLEQYRSLSEDDRLVLLRMVVEPESRSNADVQEYSRMSLAHVKEIDHVLCTQDDFVIPIRNMELVHEGLFFFLHEVMPEYEDVYASLSEMKQGTYTGYSIAQGQPGVHAVTLSADDFPLTIRNFRDGDRIEMRYGTKSVHRFFIDRHIPLYKRRTWPVLVNRAGEVIFVPLIGCDVRHYSVEPQVNVIEY